MFIISNISTTLISIHINTESIINYYKPLVGQTTYPLYIHCYKFEPKNKIVIIQPTICACSDKLILFLCNATMYAQEDKFYVILIEM